MVTTEVPFTKESGVCKVKFDINGLPLHFVFDTGPSDVTISMAKTGDLVLTIGSKTQVTAPADASTGEFYAADHTAVDGTQTARAVLLKDIVVANGSLGKAVVAYTGCFNKSKLTFGGSDTLEDQYANMLDRCIFAVDVVEE